MARHIVLIGPVAAGKTTIGVELANRLGLPFLDLDEEAPALYEEVGQGIDRLIERVRADGFVAAHRWWQPARVHAVRSVLHRSTTLVVACGAGHSHYEDERWFAEISRMLEGSFVVLLLPTTDIDASVTTLRRRCVEERGDDQDWLFDETDFIRTWVVSNQNRSLADMVAYTDGRPVEAIALEIAARVQQ